MSERKVIIITGANSGIGKAMATDLGAAGHHIVMGCRSLGRGEAAKADIEQRAKGPVGLAAGGRGEPDPGARVREGGARRRTRRWTC
ncbi:MAG: SDR family NAD(P)-dependent oxidoreductase [Sandaracinaceae bacterium]|nr:SDR family NAD(P)-dependent oxidoreductase [Sandaracinaceae bacterium]